MRQNEPQRFENVYRHLLTFYKVIYNNNLARFPEKAPY